MNDTPNSVIKNTVQKPFKKCWRVGSNTVVVIDKSIVQKLAITEEDTFLEQEIISEGILMRIKRLGV